MIEATIDLMGLKGKDKVTGFEGIVTSVSFDLYGCVQLALTPIAKPKAEELKHGHWFDVARVDIRDAKNRVMPVPDFKAMATKPQNFEHGASPKPAPGI
jgi:hypothetical protein